MIASTVIFDGIRKLASEFTTRYLPPVFVSVLACPFFATGSVVALPNLGGSNVNQDLFYLQMLDTNLREKAHAGDQLLNSLGFYDARSCAATLTGGCNE